MMIRVYGQNDQKNVVLKLEEVDEGARLICCDLEGKVLPNGVLLTLNNNGTLVMHGCISKSFGFILSQDNRLMLSNIHNAKGCEVLISTQK